MTRQPVVDGSYEQSVRLVADILGGVVLTDARLRDITAKDGTVTRHWVDIRTGERALASTP